MKKNWTARKDEDSAPEPVKGTNGNDALYGDYYGKPQVDIFYGRGGNDLLNGRAGADRLDGGDGSDSIYGELGEDRIFGGAGNDTLFGGSHDDVLSGGHGADAFFFRAWGEFSGTSGVDLITDFNPHVRGEYILLSAIPSFEITTFGELKAIMVQDDNDVVMSFGGMDLLVLKDLQISELRSDDFHIHLA